MASLSPCYLYGPCRENPFSGSAGSLDGPELRPLFRSVRGRGRSGSTVFTGRTVAVRPVIKEKRVGTPLFEVGKTQGELMQEFGKKSLFHRTGIFTQQTNCT